jgi:hypothetical protein
VAAHSPGDAAIQHSVRQSLLFAGLAQIAYVDLDQLRHAWQLEIPFIRQTVSPAAWFPYRLELLGHDSLNRTLVCAGVEVQIGSKIGPVVERLDDRDFRTASSAAWTLFARFFRRMADAGTLRAGDTTKLAVHGMGSQRPMRA